MPKRVKSATHMEQKSRYYAKRRKGATNSGTRWTDADAQAVLDHKMADGELARQCGRSVQTVQVKRSKLVRGLE